MGKKSSLKDKVKKKKSEFSESSTDNMVAAGRVRELNSW